MLAKLHHISLQIAQGWLSVLQHGKLSVAEVLCPTYDTIHGISYPVVDFMRQMALAHL